MTEHERAKAWAQRCQITAAHLSKLTGYAEISLYWFWRGETPPERNAKSGRGKDRSIRPWVWLRFKRACGDVDAELTGRKRGQRFDW